MGNLCHGAEFTSEVKEEIDLRFDYVNIALDVISLGWAIWMFSWHMGRCCCCKHWEGKLHSKNASMFIIQTVWPIISLTQHSMAAIKHADDTLKVVTD